MRDLIYKKYDYMDIELSNSIYTLRYQIYYHIIHYHFLKYNLMRYVLFIREA